MGSTCWFMWPVNTKEHEWGAEAPDFDGRKCKRCGFVLTNAQAASVFYGGKVPKCPGK